MERAMIIVVSNKEWNMPKSILMDYSRIEYEDAIVLQVMCRDGVHTCYNSKVN